MDVVLLCCKQGVALRGHRESDEEPSHVNKGNFLAILDLLVRHDPIVARRVHEGPQNAKYTHHSIQDNIIRVAALLIREQIAVETSGNYYAIIADESRDTGHKEQMSLVLRHIVQEDGIQGRHVIKESFRGFASCESLAAAGLCETLLTSLRDCGIDLLGCVAQCFDGAAVMSGRCSGVQTRIRELCPKAIYVHCFAHRLNLVIVDVVHNTARADDLFILLQSLHNFLSSPIVHEQYVKAQRSRFSDSQPREIPSLSDTRWVCRHDACETIIVTLPAVIDVLESLMDVSDLRGATARSMMVQLNTSFVIHLCIFNFLLKICADASAKLQGKSETLDEALQAIKTVCLWLDRPEIPQMDEVWEGIYNQAQDIVRVTELPQPQVRRVREVGGPVGLESSEDYRREVFVPMCNKTLAELQRRFLSEENQAVYGGVCALTPASDSFLNVEQIWLMCNFYGVAKKCNAVKTEIDLLRITFENGGDDLPTDLMGMLNFIEPHKRVLSVMDKVLYIAVTIPVTSAQAERSFSAMKRIKNFLRSTMGNTHLSDIGVLNVNAEMLCALNKESIISRFAEKPHRILL